MKGKRLPQSVVSNRKGHNILKSRPGPKPDTLSLHPQTPEEAMAAMLRVNQQREHRDLEGDNKRRKTVT